MSTLGRWQHPALFILILFCGRVNAQDGKLLERNPYTIADSSIAQWRNNMPDIDGIVAAVQVYRITYLSDGLKVKGYMAVPKGTGTFPSVIYNRGGNRKTGQLDDGALLRYMANIASWGYVVVGSQYRGNDGGEGKDEFGGADVNDVLNLMPLLAQVPEADTARIGMFGGSRGGMMTCLALTHTTRIKAAVIRAGAADAFINVNARPDMGTGVFAELIPEYATNPDSVLFTRSPARWADRMCKTTPILLEHGSADWRVTPAEVFAMAEALYACKHPFRMLFLEGADHALTEYRNEADHASRLFLDTYVRDGKTWPSLIAHGH